MVDGRSRELPGRGVVLGARKADAEVNDAEERIVDDLNVDRRSVPYKTTDQ